MENVSVDPHVSLQKYLPYITLGTGCLHHLPHLLYTTAGQGKARWLIHRLITLIMNGKL
jgi:hypothetical protein